MLQYGTLYSSRGRRVIGIVRSLFYSKTLMELIFNPCSEFWWSPEGPVSQILSPHLHAGAPGNFADLLSSVQMLKREWGVEINRKLQYLFIPRNCNLGSWVCCGRPAFGQTVTFVPAFAVKTCPWAEHSDDNDDDSVSVPHSKKCITKKLCLCLPLCEWVIVAERRD